MHICKWVLYACRKYVCETMIATVSSLTFLFYREKCINVFSSLFSLMILLIQCIYISNNINIGIFHKNYERIYVLLLKLGSFYNILLFYCYLYNNKA